MQLTFTFLHSFYFSEVTDNLEKILERGASVNFYMFHGGTNFGFMAGANYFDSTGYEPDVTSYGKYVRCTLYLFIVSTEIYNIKDCSETYKENIDTFCRNRLNVAIFPSNWNLNYCYHI